MNKLGLFEDLKLISGDVEPGTGLQDVLERSFMGAVVKKSISIHSLCINISDDDTGNRSAETGFSEDYKICLRLTVTEGMLTGMSTLSIKQKSAHSLN